MALLVVTKKQAWFIFKLLRYSNLGRVLEESYILISTLAMPFWSSQSKKSRSAPTGAMTVLALVLY